MRNGAFLPRDSVRGVRHSANDVDVGASLRKAGIEIVLGGSLVPTYTKPRADPGRYGLYMPKTVVGNWPACSSL